MTKNEIKNEIKERVLQILEEASSYKDVAHQYGVSGLSSRSGDMAIARSRKSKEKEDKFPHIRHVDQALSALYGYLKDLQSQSKKTNIDKDLDFAIRILFSYLEKKKKINEYYLNEWDTLDRLIDYVEEKTPGYLSEFRTHYEKITNLLVFAKTVVGARIHSLRTGFDLSSALETLEIPPEVKFQK